MPGLPFATMSLKALVTPAIFTGFSSRVDGSLGFRGVTPELNHQEKVALMEFHQQNVKLLIQPLESTPEAMVEVRSELNVKTPSQRLRAVLFILFKQWTESGKVKGVMFEQFYSEQMERFIQDVKGQLEPET